MIKQQDALLFLKDQADNSADIIFCDPPYALGSEITIKQDGKPDYSKAVDFMNKWEMPDGKFWEEFYKEAFRVLKFGGHCLMYGMDRQNFMFKYYGHLAGFTGKQSLYWYFISNFPKASDLSKMIDKNAGAEREVVGYRDIAYTDSGCWGIPNNNTEGSTINTNTWETVGNVEKGKRPFTAPSTPLAQKYSGYKYSVAPLKQVVEEIMVFQKPMKTGSVLHDTLAMESGDESITCGALDIDGNRVGTEKVISVGTAGKRKFQIGENNPVSIIGENSGRYPAQAFLTNTEDILDEQSGVSIKGSKGSGLTPTKARSNMNASINGINRVGYEDIAGCSKILHKCPYETEEYDLFNYCPKVSKKERNAGCEEMEEKFKAGADFRPNHTEKALQGQTGNPYGRWGKITNNHPTVKPISLNEKILRLFKTPNLQKILIPFAGSGSEVIGAYKAGFRDILGCELNEEYIKIAEARIKHWCK